MPTLRPYLQLARINRMKRRAAQAWHEAHCDACRAGVGDALTPGLQRLFDDMRRDAEALRQLTAVVPH